MKTAKNNVNRDEAERIAILAMTFLSEDDEVLGQFLALTGWTPAALQSEAARPAFFSAVLEFLLNDETLLLAFSTNSGIRPALIPAAHRQLEKNAFL